MLVDRRTASTGSCPLHKSLLRPWSTSPSPLCRFSTDWIRRPLRNCTSSEGGGGFNSSSIGGFGASLLSPLAGLFSARFLPSCGFGDGALFFFGWGFVGLEGGEGGLKEGGFSFNPAIRPSDSNF